MENRVRYHEDLESLLDKQVEFVEKNVNELHYFLDDGELAKAFECLQRGPHTSDLISFVKVLLEREVEVILGTKDYKVSSDEYHINFYNKDYQIKFPLISSEFKIILSSRNKSDDEFEEDLSSRRRIYLNELNILKLLENYYEEPSNENLIEYAKEFHLKEKIGPIEFLLNKSEYKKQTGKEVHEKIKSEVERWEHLVDVNMKEFIERDDLLMLARKVLTDFVENNWKVVME